LWEIDKKAENKDEVLETIKDGEVNERAREVERKRLI